MYMTREMNLEQAIQRWAATVRAGIANGTIEDPDEGHATEEDMKRWAEDAEERGNHELAEWYWAQFARMMKSTRDLTEEKR